MGGTCSSCGSAVEDERMGEVMNISRLPDGTSLVYEYDTRDYRFASVVRIDDSTGEELAYADIDVFRVRESDSDMIRRLNDALMEGAK